MIVAGGKGQGNNLNQLYYPEGLTFDNHGNGRIMRWREDAQDGERIAGGNGPSQLNQPIALSFDLEGNLHVTNRNNDRIQRFDLIS